MKTELLISWRYILTKRKEKFISLISLISILGIAIGVAALIIVIAVMNGFDRDLRDKIVGNYSHLTIAGYNGISSAQFSEIVNKLEATEHVRAASPYVQGQVLAKEGTRFFAVGIKGIDPELENKVTRIDKYLISGKLQELVPNTVILGKELAFYLGLEVNSNLELYSPNGKKYSLKVIGVFNSGMYDYDMNLIFTNFLTAQEVLELNGKFSAVAVKLDNLYLADKLAPEVQAAVGGNFIVRTWTQANQNFFAALKLEKLTMFIILTLIILVAAFNIASTLIVMVVRKTKDIGILKAIGMSSSGIRRIFTYQGFIIGIAGTLSGVIGGVGLCGLLKKYQFIKLPQDIYYISTLPVALDWRDISWIICAALAITLLSTIYPAACAAKLEPVEALRYE